MNHSPRLIPLLAVVVFATSASPTPSPDLPRGSLVIVGGGGRSEAMMRRFVELAGGRGARIAVVPNASSEPEETGRDLVAELDSLGARAFVYYIDRRAAATEAAARGLDSATGIWFSGGDQVRVTAALAGTPVLRAMQRRYREGAVVGGTSAGAAIMSDSMITGNQTPPGDTTGYYGDEYPAIARHRVEIVPGLGFLPQAIVDQHFIRRERHNRLLSAVLERPTLLGVGIDESTALEVGARRPLAGAGRELGGDLRRPAGARDRRRAAAAGRDRAAGARPPSGRRLRPQDRRRRPVSLTQAAGEARRLQEEPEAGGDPSRGSLRLRDPVPRLLCPTVLLRLPLPRRPRSGRGDRTGGLPLHLGAAGELGRAHVRQELSPHPVRNAALSYLRHERVVRRREAEVRDSHEVRRGQPGGLRARGGDGRRGPAGDRPAARPLPSRVHSPPGTGSDIRRGGRSAGHLPPDGGGADRTRAQVPAEGPREPSALNRM